MIEPLLCGRSWCGFLFVAILISQIPISHAFEVFDGTNFTAKPDLGQFGIKKLNLVYAGQFWDKGEDRDSVPREERILSLAHGAAVKGAVVVLDIEHWHVRAVPDAQVRQSVGKYLSVLDHFRNNAPRIKLGFYGLPPIRDYWRATKGADTAEYLAWQKENDALQAIANQVDIIYPSVYTFYSDQAGWVKYASEQIREARRLAKGKPVYAFLWPRYHDSNKMLGMQYLSAEYWKLELETMQTLADGIVIWDGARERWDDAQPWWRVTKAFLAKMKAL